MSSLIVGASDFSRRRLLAIDCFIVRLPFCVTFLRSIWLRFETVFISEMSFDIMETPQHCFGALIIMFVMMKREPTRMKEMDILCSLCNLWR